jgi:hypothetical protein
MRETKTFCSGGHAEIPLPMMMIAPAAAGPTYNLSHANSAHFDTKGTLEMGVRFAEALLRAAGKTGSPP